jgi:Flp pilus assembly protein TadG
MGCGCETELKAGRRTAGRRAGYSYLRLCRLRVGPGGRGPGLRGEDGQSLLEFALSFSVLMGLMFVFIELCLVFYTYGMIAECAREGSRYASVHGSTCVTSASTSCTLSASSINSYVSGRGFPNLGGGTITVATTFPDGNQVPGSRVKVR